MLISTDGACRWGGTPECVSCGVAFVQTNDDDIFYQATVEDGSTSQRGELHGLKLALEIALERRSDPDEDIIIITDSEYLYNSVMKEWCFKWQRNNWNGSNGVVKNVDLWADIVDLLNRLDKNTVYLQWTKGHLISSHTPSIVKKTMAADTTGISLFTNVQNVAKRSSEYDRIVTEFNGHRVRNGELAVPDTAAIDWTIANVMADLLAGYVKDVVISAAARATALPNIKTIK